MDKTETIVQLKKLLASKKAADLLKALKKLQRNYFPEFGNTVVDIFEERYKRKISWEVQDTVSSTLGDISPPFTMPWLASSPQAIMQLITINEIFFISSFLCCLFFKFLFLAANLRFFIENYAKICRIT